MFLIVVYFTCNSLKFVRGLIILKLSKYAALLSSRKVRLVKEETSEKLEICVLERFRVVSFISDDKKEVW